MHYYKRHVGDYIRTAAHLSLLEHGVYARLLDLYYLNERGFDPATVHRTAGARTPEEVAAVDAVLTDFFILADGVWQHIGCDTDIADYHRQAEINRVNGGLGGRPPRKNNRNKTEWVSDGLRMGSESQPDGNQTGTERQPVRNPNHKPETINHEPKEKIGAVALVVADDLIADGLAPDLAHELLAHRKRQRAPLSPRAWAGIKAQAAIANMRPDQAAQKMIERGWRGFEAGWLTDADRKQTAKPARPAERGYTPEELGL